MATVTRTHAVLYIYTRGSGENRYEYQLGYGQKNPKIHGEIAHIIGEFEDVTLAEAVTETIITTVTQRETVYNVAE